MNLGKRIRIKLLSYDPGLLDQAMKNIVSVVKASKTPMFGPFPKKKKKEIFTVKRSPHVYKESNEQFQLCTHKRLLDIYTDSRSVIESLSKIILPSSVRIIIR